VILTNFLYKNASISSHTILSKKMSAGDRDWVLRDLQARGANSINVYLLNEGDYGGKAVCPYAGGRWFGPELDMAELARWESIIECCIAMGLAPIFWTAADDSKVIASAWENRKQDVANILMYLAGRFDKYALAWCLGLELNEWSNRQDVDFFGSILAASVSHPVGVHQTTGRWDYASLPWCYFVMLQYGFGAKSKKYPKGHTADLGTISSMTQRAIRELGKPVVACEYSRFGESSQASAAGRQAMASGAVGACNGW